MCGQAAVDLYANPESTLLYVGKRGGQRSTPQAEIESLVVQHCLQVTPACSILCTALGCQALHS